MLCKNPITYIHRVSFNLVKLYAEARNTGVLVSLQLHLTLLIEELCTMLSSFGGRLVAIHRVLFH
uniref:Uncharacterized protein n=1 Tax=Helianthus annuus TaxID=4232 RepID=A0A251TEE5_HELAN